MLGAEVLAGGLVARDVRLERGQLALSGGGALVGVCDLAVQPVDLFLAGLDPAPAGRHLAGEPGKALAAVGGGAEQGTDPPLLLALGLLGLVPRVDGVRERLACRGHRLGQGGLLLPDGARLGGELLRIAAARAFRPSLDHVREQTAAVGGEGRRAADAFAQAGEPVPGLLGARVLR